MICVGCNNTKSHNVDLTLEGETLEMFNFVCCLEISEPEISQGICNYCLDELKVSFNFKKRCLQIFANIFEHTNAETVDQNEDDIETSFMNSILDQSLHEDDSINLNDLLIPEVCLGNSALSALDVSDQTKCRYCFKEFLSKEDCQAHLEEHKGDDKPYKCPHVGCDSSFKARKNLKDHYLVHSNERPFPCHFCQQTFKSSSNRSKHERRIHTKERNAMRAVVKEDEAKKIEVKVENQQKEPKSSSYNLVAPEVKISTNATVTTNLKRESQEPADKGERIYKCEQEGCTSSFRTRSSLRDHQKVHSEERPYKCNFCASAFKSSSNRSKHERGSHSEQYQKRKLEREVGRMNAENSVVAAKKIKLDVVSSNEVKPIFNQEISSISTVSMVTTPQPQTQRKTIQSFACRYCDRVFKQTENRDKHEKTHKDFLAYDCGYCYKNFKSQELLREHLRIHIEQTKFSCTHPSCTEVFQDRRSLREHKNTHEPEEFICEIETCGRIFASPKALKNHKKQSKHFSTTNDSNENLNHEIIELIECDICSSKFHSDALQEHLRLHI